MVPPTPPTGFDPAVGWLAVPAVLDAGQVHGIATACAALTARLEAEGPGAPGLEAGDKVAGGTQHLNGLVDRIPASSAVLAHRGLLAVVDEAFGGPGVAGDIGYRNPRPGFGGQKLHADAVPQTDGEHPTQVVTAIVALVDFTAVNGATRVVPGSHLRPDLQRRAGGLDAHPDEILLTGPAGTAFVFSGHLLHSGTVNRSDRPRPALQVVWRRADPGRR